MDLRMCVTVNHVNHSEFIVDPTGVQIQIIETL